MRFLLSIVAILLATAATAAPSAPTAAASSSSACSSKADREKLKGGVRRTYMRECLAGEKIDRAKTFQGAKSTGKPQDHRCIGASRLGKCER